MKKGKVTLLSKTLQTVGLIISSIILWIVIYYIGRGAIYLLDVFRGLDSDLIQGVGIELIVPGVAMYFSLNICKSIFSNSWLKIGLVLSLLLFFILYFFFGSLIKPTYEIVKTFDRIFKIGFIISIIIASVSSYFEINKND